MEFSPFDLEKLCELLRPPEPEVLQGDDLPSKGFDIQRVEEKSKNTEKPIKTIEEYEEQEANQFEKELENRKEPKYTLNYKQAVTAEDVFLQMGFKTPASASCEHLVVRIEMPGDKRENIDLNVTKELITVFSSRYSLKLPLPHPVDPDASNASWDSSISTLILTLKLDREFDDLNN